MFEKQGKFYADWRDRKGVRKRKSFTSARAAIRFEEEQKELAHPKPKAQGRRSPRFSVPDTKSTPGHQRTKPSPRKPSSRRPAASRPKTSAPRTS